MIYSIQPPVKTQSYLGVETYRCGAERGGHLRLLSEEKKVENGLNINQAVFALLFHHYCLLIIERCVLISGKDAVKFSYPSFDEQSERLICLYINKQ